MGTRELEIFPAIIINLLLIYYQFTVESTKYAPGIYSFELYRTKGSWKRCKRANINHILLESRLITLFSYDPYINIITLSKIFDFESVIRGRLSFLRKIKLLRGR